MNTLLSPLNRLGVRVQLTFWYTLVLASIIFGCGAFVYKYLESSLESSVDTALSLQFHQIASEVSYHNGHILINDITGDLPNPSTPQTSAQPQTTTSDVGASSAIVRVLDMKGNVIRENHVFRLIPMPSDVLSLSLQGTAWNGTIKTHTGQEVRVYSAALFDQGAPFAVVQVGASLDQLHNVLRRTAILLLLLVPLILLVSAVVSYWLAGRAFAPIHRLTATARKIGAGDLRQRVPVPPAQDEVHFLALTLNEMIEHLDEAFKRQRRFVADASHELRTPVAAIRSKTDVALLQPLSAAEYRHVIQGINTEVGRLGHLISDLLALARADEGQSPLVLEPVQLDVLVEAVAANAEPLAQERNINLRVQVSEPVTVQGDEARLIQVVMNLLDNALIYTRSGGCVTLLVGRDQDTARIIVRDTGVGIAPEHLPHIFERFYRADPARQRREGNSNGLGLAIVDWAVRAHDGSVSVESTPGQGSTFTVALPLKKALISA